MDREACDKADQTFREKLLERLEANSTTIMLDQLMGRSQEAKALEEERED